MVELLRKFGVICVPLNLNSLLKLMFCFPHVRLLRELFTFNTQQGNSVLSSSLFLYYKNIGKTVIFKYTYFSYSILQK